MDISAQLLDEMFTLMVGISTAPLSLTLEWLSLSARWCRSREQSRPFIIFTVWYPSASLFPGNTRIVRLKNRAIAWFGIKLGGVDLSKMNSTNQESDEHSVDCLRCGSFLTFTHFGFIHGTMKTHEQRCTGRNFCEKCFTIYSGQFGIRGSSQVMHEKREELSRGARFPSNDRLVSQPNPLVSDEYGGK